MVDLIVDVPAICLPSALQKNGSVDHISVLADVVFFESCPDCLHMDYRGSVGHYLVIYSKHTRTTRHVEKNLICSGGKKPCFLQAAPFTSGPLSFLLFRR